MKLASLFIFLTLFFSLSPETFPETSQEMTAALHVHSKVSGSKSEMSELAIRARQKGIDAVILTDYFEQKVELGFYPLHRWIKIGYRRPSIAAFGTEKYFRAIEEVNRHYPGVFLIPGAEVTPAYWWSGSLFKNNLTVHDLQKNMLVFGLKAGALEKIPTVSNGLSKSDAYHGGRNGEAAYQEIAEDVNAKGGLAVWSTPDENPGTFFRKGPVQFRTDPYTESLNRTDNITGVCVLPEGFTRTGTAGGAWDQALKSYCRGRRKQPLWVFAELIMHDIHPIDIDHRFNVAWVAGKSVDELLKSLRLGRFYALQRGRTSRPVLNLFSVRNEKGEEAESGQLLEAGGPVRVEARVEYISDLNPEVTLELIRMGEVVEEVRGLNQAELVFTDDLSEETGKIYYRIAAKISEPETGVLLSNPIFVSKKMKPTGES